MSARNHSISFQSSMEATSLVCNLPEDLVTKILLRLPVKSILRFKAVSKSWYAFLTSSTFTSLYLREPIIAHKLLKVCYTNPISFIPKISLIVLNDNNCFRASDVCLPFPINPNDEVMVEDSCNGLVCLTMNSQSKIILWNPITRKYRFIELPSCASFEDRLASVGLGFVPVSNDYKIVRIPFHHAKATVFWVYTLSSDSWKKLEVSLPFVPLRYRQPTFVGDRMHWITLEDMKVMRIAGFELNNEVLQVMEVPDSHGFHTGIKRKLLIINDCLSMIVSLELEATNSNFEIWMMAEYGIQESWTKLFTVGTLPMARARQPLVSMQDGKILFQYSTENSEQMLLYDHVTQGINYLPDCGSFLFHVFNYVESLESVGKSRRRAKDCLQRS